MHAIVDLHRRVRKRIAAFARNFPTGTRREKSQKVTPGLFPTARTGIQ
jgi:hypothetical protein